MSAQRLNSDQEESLGIWMDQTHNWSFWKNIPKIAVRMKQKPNFLMDLFNSMFYLLIVQI